MSEKPRILFVDDEATLRTQEGEEKFGLECTASAYLIKPFEAPVLLGKIQELLTR